MAEVLQKNEQLIRDTRSQLMELIPETNAKLDDNDISRFLRARNLNVQKSVEMIQKWAIWRSQPITDGSSFTPENILENLDDVNEDIYRRLLPHSNMGHDKEGRPVYFEKTGIISGRMTEILGILTADDLVVRHVRQQEMMIQRLLLASEKCGRAIEKQTIVFDLKGLSYSLNTTAISLFKRTIEIDQNYYPERLQYFIMVNAPWFFKTIWALIHPFLDPITAKKFNILGSNYIDDLRKFIDDDQIPKEMGGSCETFSWVDPTNWPESIEYLSAKAAILHDCKVVAKEASSDQEVAMSISVAGAIGEITPAATAEESTLSFEGPIEKGEAAVGADDCEPAAALSGSGATQVTLPASAMTVDDTGKA